MKDILLTIISLLGLCFGASAQVLSDSTFTRMPETDFPVTMASGTLPLIEIITEDYQPIVSKDTALNATMNITVPRNYETFNGDSVASQSDLELTIRGRGNTSWKGLIKPYKVKFTSKQSILGLPSQKHFALLPFAGYLNYLTGFGGLEVAKLFDWWVPRVEPVELAINGEYRGKYYLTESIKINKNRLNIFEQPDSITDPDIIPYGWLIEIDNHPEPETSISIVEQGKINLNVTHHVPEVVTDRQRQWLIDEMTKINDAIYRYDDSWVEYIDPVSAARYFIIRELFWDPDGYAGSMYLYRDKGAWNEPWHFGPMWDIASGHTEKYSWVHESNHHYGIHWFPALVKSELFMEHVRLEFAKLNAKRNEIAQIYKKIQRYCQPAHKANFARWGYPAVPVGMENDAYYYTTLLNHNLDWMNETLDYRPITVSIDELHVSGNVVGLSALAAEALPVTMTTISGRVAATFTLQPGENIKLTGRHGIFVLTAPGQKPRKLLL